jgi:hypothetical protein
MCLFEHDSVNGENIYVYCHIHNWLDIIVPVMAITVGVLVIRTVWRRLRR